MTKKIRINVRYYGGGYLARGEGKIARARTSEAAAAERVAMKVQTGLKDVCRLTAEGQGIRLVRESNYKYRLRRPARYTAEWEIGR